MFLTRVYRGHVWLNVCVCVCVRAPMIYAPSFDRIREARVRESNEQAYFCACLEDVVWLVRD